MAMRREWLRILIVQDRPDQLASLVNVLGDEGYQVVGARTAAEASEYARCESFAVAVVDVQAPDVSEVSLLSLLKAKNAQIQMILSPAFASLDSAIEAVRRGAADYLLKPIDPPQILSRVRQVLSEQQPNRRRAIMNEMQRLLGELNEIDGFHTEETPGQATPAEESERYLRRGPFILDLHTRVASLNTEELSLTPTGFDYLTVLMRFSPNTLGYQKLVLEAQGYETTPIEAKEVTRWRIHELRKAIEQDSRNPRYLITVRGEGYRLVT